MRLSRRQQGILLGIVLVLLAAVFYLVKCKGYLLVEDLYHQGRYDFLNRITVSEGQPSLDYYQGKMEEEVWGPIYQTVAGLALLLFAVFFLRKSSLPVFALTIFVFLLMTKWEVLFFPPYGDAIGGPFAEGIWLAQNSFNYLGLAQQDGYMQGGPKVYVFTIFPTYLALGMTLIPSVKWFLIVNHLIVFLEAALVIAIFRQILLKVFSAEIALLASLLLLGMPIFQSQAEAINMEMPGLFFSAWAIHFLIGKRMPMASLAAIMALLSRDTGIITCMTVFFIGLGLFLFDEEKRFNKKTLAWGFLPVLFVGAKVSTSFWFTFFYPQSGMVSWLVGWPSLKHFETLRMYAVSLAVFVGFAVYQSWRGRKSFLRGLFKENYLPLVMFTFTGFWFLFFLNFFAVSHRYRLLLHPFIIFCVLFALVLVIPKEKWIGWGLIPVVLFTFYASFGLLYGPLIHNDHVLLERSLEYRNDLKLNMRVARELENHYEGYRIGAPFIVAQSLGMPELGYVQKKLDVMIYGMSCSYGGIKNFTGLSSLDLRKTIWIGVSNTNPPGVEYPIDPQDQVVKQLEVGDKMASLFMGGIAIEKTRMAVKLLLYNRIKEKNRHPP